MRLEATDATSPGNRNTCGRPIWYADWHTGSLFESQRHIQHGFRYARFDAGLRRRRLFPRRAESCKSYRLSSLNLTLTFRGTGEPVGRNGARNDGRPPLPTQITYALPRLSQESNDSAPIFYRLSADHLPDSSTPRFASNVASSRRGTIRVRRDSNFSNILSFAIPDLAEVNIKQGLYTCHPVYEGGKLGSKINSS